MWGYDVFGARGDRFLRHAAHPELRFDAGFAHEAAMRGMAGRRENAMACLAGPPPMVDATLRALVTEADWLRRRFVTTSSVEPGRERRAVVNGGPGR